MADRKIKWLESVDQANSVTLSELESKLADFYSNNNTYYTDIDFTASNWIDKTETGYQEIINNIPASGGICEIGCGSANILRHFPELQPRYMGCDFSTELCTRNRTAYPNATFVPITQPNRLPFGSEEFNFVFSVFVLEHSTRPGDLLRESARILKPGGKMIVLCPDFMGQGRMTSQRAGFTAGTAREKIKQRKFVDALVTLFDNRIRIPWACRKFAGAAAVSPKFFINVNPVVFQDPFTPDVDAVYLTYKAEIISYLSGQMTVMENSRSLQEYESQRKIIFLSFVKAQ